MLVPPSPSNPPFATDPPFIGDTPSLTDKPVIGDTPLVADNPFMDPAADTPLLGDTYSRDDSPVVANPTPVTVVLDAAVPPTDLVARAERAVWLSGTDPERADAEAKAVLADAWTGRHDEAASVALRASALAARELGDLTLAQDRLRKAVTIGDTFPRRVAQARMSLVTVRAQLGDPEDGLRLADLAERDLSGTDLARLGVQRSVALMLLGRHREAVHHCDRAIRLLEGDPKFQSGGLLNRGLALSYLEEYGRAARDLAECARVARSAGLDHVAMLAEGNMPFVAARRGDISAAFDSYRAAEGALFGYPERLAAMRVDFAEALVTARLPGEARALLELAVPDLAASGAQAGLADARLLLAQVELLSGDARQAQASAETACSELIRQGRDSWAGLATEVVLRARLAQEPPGRELLKALLSCASELAEVGWTSGSAAVRLTAAKTAQQLGDLATTHEQLDLLVAPAIASVIGSETMAGTETVLDTRTPVGTRTVVRQHARAMRLHLDGDQRGALAAAWSGLLAALPRRSVPAETIPYDATHNASRPHCHVGAYDGDAADQESSLISSPAISPSPPQQPAPDPATATEDFEARAYAARVAEDLAEFGMRLALETRDAWTVLTWAERWRALVRGNRPPSGFRVNATSDADTTAEHGTETKLLRGSLVEFVRSGDDLVAVMVTCRGGELRSLGSYTRAIEATVRIRYGLRRRNLRDVQAEHGLERELVALDEQLLGSLNLVPGPVVVVPTGALHTLPWPLLPSLRGRAVSVSSEATSWLTNGTNDGHTYGPGVSTSAKEEHDAASGAAQAAYGPALIGMPGLPVHGPEAASGVARAPHPPIVVAVAGPGLEHGEAEADMVVGSHQGATRIRATKGEVLAALEQADVLHVAAHGMFSPRSPMLSRITLDDGPLMAYDLLRLRRAPRLVILSACDAGMAYAPVDGTTLGLAGAFLDRGTTCVIAGVVPVRDDEALTLMTVFHALLASGERPAEALGSAADKTGIGGFVCFSSRNSDSATMTDLVD